MCHVGVERDDQRSVLAGRGLHRAPERKDRFVPRRVAEVDRHRERSGLLVQRRDGRRKTIARRAHDGDVAERQRALVGEKDRAPRELDREL